MKTILLSLIAPFTFTFVSAQDGATPGFQKGDAFLTGSVSFNTEKTGNYMKSTVFTIAPKAGYFISNNIALGVGLAYVNGNSDVNDGYNTPYEQTTTGFEAGVFGRYYFNPASSFSIFTQLSAAYATTKNEYDSAGGFESETKVNGFNVAFSPGVNYFLSEHFALETSFGIVNYQSRKPDVSGAVSTNSFNIGLDLANVYFGLIYKF